MPPRKRNSGTGNRPNEDQRLEMVRTALQVRRDGGTWDMAAREAGYADKGSCHHSVTRFLRQNAVESAEEYRQLQLLRYERQLLAVLPFALGRRGNDGSWIDRPNLAYLEEARRLGDSIARLVGANAPSKVEVSSEIDAEIKRLAAELGMADTGDIRQFGELGGER